MLRDQICTTVGAAAIRRAGERRSRVPGRSLHDLLSQKVFLQKSIPAQIRQLILYASHNKGQVDKFVPELTFPERLHGHIL